MTLLTLSIPLIKTYWTLAATVFTLIVIAAYLYKSTTAKI